jgi:hypothetical protein
MTGLFQSLRRWYQRHLSYQPSRTYMRGPASAPAKGSPDASETSNNPHQMT